MTSSSTTAALVFAAIEQATDGVLVTDLKGTIVYVNAAACRASGYTREELVGQKPSLLKSGAHDAAFYRELWDTVTSGRIWTGDIIDRRKDGTLSVERTTITPVLDQTGAATHFVALKRDATDAKQREETLEQIRYSIDRAADFILWTDTAGHIVYANETASHSLGYSVDEMLRLYVWDTNPDITPDNWTSLWNRTKALGTLTAETQRRRRDGNTFPVELCGTYVVFHGREYLCVIGRDITQRKRDQEAVQASEARYRQLFERNLAGVYRSTLEGAIVECNEAFVRIFGYESREAALRSPATSLYSSPQARDVFVARLRREGVLQNYEAKARRANGEAIYTLENAALVEDGIIEGTLVDVTMQRMLEEQIRQTQKMEAVGRLAGGIAHDFNNLLGVINGFGELVLRGLGDRDPLRQKVEQIVRAGERAADLTRQLLAFSRLQVLQPKVLDLNAVVADMERMLQRLIGVDVELVTSLDPQLGNVRADPGQVEQVVMNLAINARDAMPDGGRLTIETRNVELDAEYTTRHAQAAPGPYVMIAISDTGVGMEPEVQARIFEPFFTTKQMGRGTGLGLSTVYGIVNQSAGSIWVYSEVGVGTTFKIYLPRLQDCVEKPAEARSPAAGHGESILLVEDEAALRDLLRETLEASGYSVLVARDGAEAFQIADSHQGSIDLLITDVIMPGINGHAVSSAITAADPRTRVLYISGYADDAIVRHGVLDHGAAFLSKPFGLDDLLRAVKDVLDRN